MYVDLKIGKRGEIVIPAFIRKKFRLDYGGKLRAKVEENSLEFQLGESDALAVAREMSKRSGLSDKEIEGLWREARDAY